MENCPLWGQDNRVDKKERPRFKMKYPYAVAAIEITNNTPGNIVVASAGIKATEDIVGEFTIDNSGKLTKINGKTSSTATTTIKNAPISSANTQTFYMPVKPFTAAAGKKLTVYVNGSYRDITLEKELKFEAGKITTISVPVYPLSFPTESDALEAKTASNENMLTLNGYKEHSVIANGATINPVYVIGDGTSQSLTLYGTTKDMVNALDVGFYATHWNEKPTAMTVSKIQVWFPYNNELVKLSDYKPLSTVLKNEVRDAFILSSTADLAVEIVMGTLSNGIKRDKESSLDFVYLTRFIDPQSITFNRIVSNGAPEPLSDSDIPNIISLNDEPIYKEIKGTTVDNLFKTRFAYTDKTTKVTTYPTFAGMRDIINGTNESGEADLTANALYNKIKDVVVSKGTISMTVDVKFKKYDISINMANVFNALIPSVEALKEMLPKMKFQIEISTCPYHADKASGYGTKAKPIALSAIQGDYNPIVFWGFDVYADNSSK